MTTHGKSRLKVPGATALLRADHKKVADLLADYAAACSPARTKLVAQACIELSVRAQGDVEVPRSHVRRHVKEDQNERFSQAIATRRDMAALGVALAGRKAELMAQRRVS